MYNNLTDKKGSILDKTNKIDFDNLENINMDNLDEM